MNNLTDFLVAGPNLVFLVAGCIVLGLFVTELIMMVVGHSLLNHGDIDFTLDANGNGIPDYLEGGNFDFLSVLNPGHIPVTMLMLAFCGILTILGFSGQWIWLGMTGSLAPGILSVPIALVPTFALTSLTSKGLSYVMPKDVSNAIALESLQGNVGVVIAGPIRGLDDFGIARFTDSHGVDHSIMVSGNNTNPIFNGDRVVLEGPHPNKAIAFVVRKI
jgi:hypothetical protein